MERVSTQDKDFYMGLCLAVSSTLFIGASFVIKKKGLIRQSHKGMLRAGSGGFGYLREWIWWLGLITMGVGELANFAAYAFAPASLVTPLGALSVLVSAVLASRYLNEHLNLLGKLGCVLCVLGSSVIVIHSPKEETVDSVSILLDKLHSAKFFAYIITLVFTAFIICFHLGPKYGDRNVLVYIILCSAIGSLTVISCKGLGLALKESLSGKEDDLNSWVLYVFFSTVVVCIFIQMNYLNKALDLFSTSVVTPVYYVFFTTLVIIASSIVFNEWNRMRFEDILGNVCGFLIVVIAIFMLNAFKDIDICLSDVSGLWRPKHELLRGDKFHSYHSTLVRNV